MAFIGEDEAAATSDDPFDVVQRVQEKMQKISNVANERDRIFAEGQGKEWNVAMMGAGIAFAIYYFLIRR